MLFTARSLVAVLATTLLVLVGTGGFPTAARACRGVTLEGGKETTAQVARSPQRRFFPIGLYCVNSRVQGGTYSLAVIQEFPEIARAGFNLIQSYQFEADPAATGAARTYLDAAHQNGLKVLMGVSVNLESSTMNRDLAHIRKRVATLKDHPALFGWQLYDEPSLTTPPISPRNLQRAYDAIKATDPAHPVSIGDPVIDELKSIKNYLYFDVNAFDVLLTDGFSLIPLSNHIERRKALGKAVKHFARRNVSIINAIWVYNLAKDRITCPPNDPTYYPECVINRYPTRGEIRFLAYDSIILGSYGVYFNCYRFNYDDSDPGDDISPSANPTQWQVVASVAGELRSVRKILLAPTLDLQAAGVTLTKGSQIGTMIKKYRGRTYLFTTNPSANPAQLTIHLKAVRGRPKPTVTLLPERQRVPLQGASFSASWDPYDVRIYEISGIETVSP